MHQTIQTLAKAAPSYRVAVIGDAMIDENIEGPVLRISPEAPVPLLHKGVRKALPGGAANVASCIAALGTQCALIGLVGNDASAQELRMTLQQLYPHNFIDRLVSDSSRHTTVKTRFWGTGFGAKHLLLRVDSESPPVSTGREKEEIIRSVKDLRPKENGQGYDFIAISDYAKGVIDVDVLNTVIKLGIPVIVAPKPVNNSYNHLKGSIKGLHTLIPNLAEAKALAKLYGCQSEELTEIAKTLQAEFNSRIVITLGKDGIYARDIDGTSYHDSTKARDVYDVTGAGDAVLAAYTVASCAKLSLRDAIHIANLAAGVKVGKVGVATVTMQELLQSVESSR